MTREELAFEFCTTPYGDMVAAATDAGLCRLLPPGDTLESLFTWAARHLPGVEPVHRSGAAGELRAQIDAYFAGALHDFDLPLDLRGTPFQRAVWREVCAIPYGETRSYVEIARAVGKPAAARAVGAANAINPLCLIIPCHRVIGADGTLKGYAGGVLNRRILLGLEQAAAPSRAVACLKPRS